MRGSGWHPGIYKEGRRKKGERWRERTRENGLAGRLVGREEGERGYWGWGGGEKADSNHSHTEQKPHSHSSS